MSADRRLAAILFSDIVGYTALMERNEQAGLRARERHRRLLRPLAARHHGKIVDENGDELVGAFPSALDAVSCALAAQAALREDEELKLRIGIHSGDVIFEGGRVYGDGVNVASRIRPFAEPGGVAVSEPVFDAVKNQTGVQARPLGTHPLKNVSRPLAVYAVKGVVATPIRSRANRSPVRRAGVGVAVLLAVATALTLARELPLSAAGSGASVAVLPFADLSADHNQEYFADGMTEEIISSLARLPDLRVVARTSAFAFRGDRGDPRAIGEQLGVGNVLEGSLGRSGDRLRLSARLVSVANGDRLWSETYERPVSDVFAIQEAVAKRVAEALSVRIAGRSLAPGPPRDLRAYELYLNGRHLVALRSEDSMRRAIGHFERALVLAPSYAPALCGLADALTQLAVRGFDTSRDVVERAREAAQAAIRADPSLGEAHASLGRQLFAGGTWDWDEADEHLQRALELSPGYAPAHLWRAQMLMARGRVREGSAEIQGALELDPLAPDVLWTAGRFAFYLGDQDRAIELLRRAVDLSPDSSQAQWYLRDAYAVAGREEEAAETLLAAAPPAAQAELRSAYEAGGPNTLLTRFLRLEQERTGQLCTSPAGAGASLYAQLGDADGVFHCLQQAARTGEVTQTELDPLFASYRSDARYAAYLEAMNLRE